MSCDTEDTRDTENTREYKISVRSFVEFLLRNGDIRPGYSFFSISRAMTGTIIHSKLQKNAKRKCRTYTAEKTLSTEIYKDGIRLRLEGRCDGFWIKGDTLVVDEIKTVEYSYEDKRIPDAVHIAQALCYAAMLLNNPEYTRENVCLRVIYYNITDEKQSESRTALTKKDVEDCFESLTDEYFSWLHQFVQRQMKFQNELKDLTFPFEEYRSGQRRLAVSVYKRIVDDDGGLLYVNASTGTGKTISVLFPSLKAMCREVSNVEISKIFYLTATSSGASAPEAAAAMLIKQLPSMNVITLTSKEKICVCESCECTPEICKRALGHYDRVNMCVQKAITEGGIITKERILALSEEYCVCPFELQLDIALACDLIICDYNYLFDPEVRLKRFFSDGQSASFFEKAPQKKKYPYIYLIDEAHNLPSRARSMYSASLKTRRISGFKNLINRCVGTDTKSFDIGHRLFELREYITNPYKLNTEPGKASILYDKNIIDFTDQFCLAVYRFLNQKQLKGSTRKKFFEYYFEIRYFCETAKRYNSNYRSFLEVEKNDGSDSSGYSRYEDTSYTLLCTDPSEEIRRIAETGRAAVFFSGTMQPFEYCALSLGANYFTDRFIHIPSPFPLENRLSIAVPDVSTIYSKREQYYGTIVQYIYMIRDYAQEVCGGKGNFIFFFSSYKYMHDITDMLDSDFKEKYIFMQPNNPTSDEIDAFLAGFENEPRNIHIGMCVLGSLFSEGIDLPGSRLSGAVIVGVGMPMVCTERDIMAEYYESIKKGSGFANAYIYPGINKVLQAAGRVIRTADDRGFVLFLDSRYFTKGYEDIFHDDYIVNKAKNFNEVKALLFDFKL